jgi:hypothetical protein
MQRTAYALPFQKRQQHNPALIRAELIGVDTCIAPACGMSIVRSPTPVLAMCRALVAAGHDPSTRMHAYRGGTLALKVRSIGEAALLKIDGKGTGFVALSPVGIASPTRKSAAAGAEHHHNHESTCDAPTVLGAGVKTPA